MPLKLGLMETVAGPVGCQYRVRPDTALEMGCQEDEDIEFVRRQPQIPSS